MWLFRKGKGKQIKESLENFFYLDSSKTKESQSDPSSWAILRSQKSAFISTVADTRTTDSSSSLPSLMGKLQGSCKLKSFFYKKLWHWMVDQRITCAMYAHT